MVEKQFVLLDDQATPPGYPPYTLARAKEIADAYAAQHPGDTVQVFAGSISGPVLYTAFVDPGPPPPPDAGPPQPSPEVLAWVQEFFAWILKELPTIHNTGGSPP